MDHSHARKAAEDHVNKIRREKGLDEPSNNADDLEAALVLLSEQLYQNSTHFLLELIQNADDNNYDDPEPTLKLTYKAGCLRIDCNEIGFSKENIEAICRIGRSTKVGTDHSTGYIGEKGIGFKSVFKVADIVWIYSRGYSFKFDKAAKLGMIAPIWAEFPDSVLPGYTSMYLQLLKDYDSAELIRELQLLDSRLLVFLRKLRRVDIQVTQDDQKTRNSTLCRHDSEIREGGREIAILKQNDEVLHYIVTRYIVQDMPHEPKRPGCSQSEVLLAFPLNATGQPKTFSQSVYTFLPIRDFGFKFLIQADFLLIANREDIVSYSMWNRALLDAIPQAFLEAVGSFNRGDLRYSWTQYLPLRPNLRDFFEPLEKKTLEALAKQPILESYDGLLTLPSKLNYVPDEFKDDNHEPFTLNDESKTRYLSFKYPFSAWSILQRIGVEKLSPGGFLLDLRLFIDKHGLDFQRKPEHWHSCLARCLITFCSKYSSILAQLQVIPLRDDQWVSANRGSILFPEGSRPLAIPDGIEVFEVQQKAQDDTSRRQLFTLLGVKPSHAAEICELILRKHSLVYPPTLSSRTELTQLVSHATYLFKAGWENKKNAELWFATEAGGVSRGSQVYMDSSVPHSATRLFAERRQEFPFLHTDYMSAVLEAKDDWIKWLQQHGHVARVPRLTSVQSGPSFDLSPDFKFVVDTWPSSEFLLLLRDEWHYYSQRVPDDFKSRSPLWSSSVAKVTEQLGSALVKCRDNTLQRLDRTFLPLSEVMLEESLDLFPLDVPEPDNPNWRILEHFGVTVKFGVEVYLKCLERLQGAESSQEEVYKLYRKIQAKSNEDLDLVKDTFANKSVFYAPSRARSDSSPWLGKSACVWDGPGFLTRTLCIKHVYPENAPLFRGILNIPDFDIATLVAEAETFSVYDDLTRIKQVFMTINQLLMDNSSEGKQALQYLHTCMIFPLRTSNRSSGFDQLSSGAPGETWFISDRIHLQDSFQGVVPLLAFSVDEVEKVALFLQAMGFHDRMLSNAATGIPRAEGSVEPRSEYRELLRPKVDFIIRLMPEEMVRSQQIIKRLRNIEVFEAEKVVMEWIITIDQWHLFKGRPDSGRIMLKPEGNILEIYMCKEDLEELCPPLELAEELAKFCAIEDASSVRLLQYVLAQKSVRSIEETFRRRGIAKERPSFYQRNAPMQRSEIIPLMQESGTSSATQTLVKPPSMEESEHAQILNSELLQSREEREGDRLDRLETIDRLDKLKKIIATVQPEADDNNRTDSVSSVQDEGEPGDRLFRSMMARNWSPNVAVENVMRQMCELENRAAEPFLPQASSTPSQDEFQYEPGTANNISEPVFLEDENNLPIESADEQTEQLIALPAKVEVSRGGGSRVQIRKRHQTDQELVFVGEIFVSKLLKDLLGKYYNPRKHWTSNMRSRAGLGSFKRRKATQTTFTVPDKSGLLTESLIQKSYKKASKWSATYPVYHLEVRTSTLPLGSSATLSSDLINQARKFSIPKETDVQPQNVFVLIWVFNINDTPNIALFVDPWRMHLSGELLLSSTGEYNVSLRNDRSYISFRANDLIGLDHSQWYIRKSSSIWNYFKGKTKYEDLTDSSYRPYKYKPLKSHRHIRLLELSPGKGEKPLKGTLYHTSLDAPGSYKAISYVWGAGLTPWMLETPDGRIRITDSLNSALLRIRHRKKSILIWADAICIDQTNVHEKALQIQLMANIYESASCVIAWLGDELDHSHLAIETLMQIKTQVVRTDTWPEDLRPVPSSWTGRRIPHPQNPVLGYIDAFLGRPWFRRAWIVQELTFASNVTVLCGKWTVQWDDLFRAVAICHEELPTAASNPNEKNVLLHAQPAIALGNIRDLYHSPEHAGKQLDLLTLLELFAHTQATREQDKLFALIGLASDTDNEGFYADYHSPFDVVARRYAAVFVQRGRVMDLLYRAGLGSKTAPTFPTWIPDWISNPFPQSITTWSSAGGKFSASGNTTSQAHLLSKRQDIVVVTGLIVDTITRVGRFHRKESDIISFLNEVYTTVESLQTYPTGEELEDVKWKVPIGNASRSPLPDSTETAFRQASKAATDISGIENPNSDFRPGIGKIESIGAMANFLKQPRKLRDKAWAYWHTAAHFSRKISNGRVCVTERGYVGIMPGTTQVGDVISIFHGGAVPFVLRKSKGKTVPYQFLGESYVHGIMHGEALSFEDEDEDEEIYVQDIQLW